MKNQAAIFCSLIQRRTVDMRRGCGIIFALIMTVGVVMCPVAQVKSAGEDALTLSLEQAKQLAVDNSPAVSLANARISKDQVNAAEQLANRQRALSGHSDGSFEFGIVRNGYVLDAARTSLQLSEKFKEQTIVAVEYGVEVNYYSLLKAMRNVELKQGTVEVAHKNAELTNEKHQLGLASALEKLSADNNLVRAKTALEIADRAKDYASMQLAHAMCVDLDTVFDLTDQLTPKRFVSVDINACVTRALNQRFDVISANEADRLNAKELSILESYFTQNTYRYKQRAFEVETARQANINKRNEISLSVHKSYYDAQDAYSAVQLAENAIIQQQMILNIAQSKYDTGLGTMLELLEAHNQMDSAQSALLDAQLGYHLARTAFEINSSIGLPGGA